MEGSELRGSQLGRYFLEARRRREEQARRQQEEVREEEVFPEPPPPEPIPEPTPPEPIPEPPVEERDFVEEAIAKISTDIQPPLEFALGDLEDTIGRFVYSATDNDIRGMREELENFSRGLEIIKDLLGDFHKEIMNVFTQTKRGIDAQSIVNRTLDKENVKEEVRELLDLLHRSSEDAMKVRYDVPESKELAVLLQSIFDYGEAHFDYEAPEVMVEMDVSKDEEVAQKLAESIEKEERRVRFEGFDEPTERIGGVVGMRRSVPRVRRVPTTVPPPPLIRSASLFEAQALVREHPEIDRGTMKEILVSEGFSTDVIRESLRTKVEARVGTARHLEDIPRREPPLPEKRVDLSGLSFGDLRDIAELYSLPAYEGMSKSELIAHIHRNIDKTILRDILRERFSKVDYEFKNIPIIYSE